MTRARRIAALVLAAAATVALAPAAHAAPKVKARLTACQTSLAAIERSGVFEGEMRTRPGAARMQMRFRLLVRTPDNAKWTAVATAGFDEWTSSDPGVGRYVYTKKVENMLAPAEYRVLVRFRWLDGAGKVLERARKLTPRCRQPDLRPDLRASRIDVGAGGQPGRARYVIAVRNRGRTPAGPFDLVLTVNGAALPTEAVLGLAPGQRRLVAVSGPACEPGSTLSVTLDPDNRVAERDEGDNALSRSCPAPT